MIESNFEASLAILRCATPQWQRASTCPEMISEYEKFQIVEAFKACGNYSKVSKRFSVSRKCVRRWVQRFNDTGSVHALCSTGRKAVLDADATNVALEMLKGGAFSGSHEVAKELHKLGKTQGDTPVHRTTVVRHAKKLAAELGQPIRPVRSRPKKKLKDANAAKRVQFCLAVKKMNKKLWAFSDRVRLHNRYPGVHIERVRWCEKGQDREEFMANNPSAYNMYAALTCFGVTTPHSVAGTTGEKHEFLNQKGKPAKSITMAQYKSVLHDTLLPQCNAMFAANGISNWYFQQDNDPSHPKAAKQEIKAWDAAHPGQAITLIENWPPNSPDLNLIENVWAYVKAKVEKAGPLNMADFKQCILNTLKNIPKSMIRNLYASMDDRIKACIENEGRKTKY